MTFAEDSNAELNAILEEGNLKVAFQPIVAVWHGNILGYEALIRGPSSSPLHAPANLFDAAVRYERLLALETLCNEVSVRQFMALGLPGCLFLNVTCASLPQLKLRKDTLLAGARQIGFEPERLTLEVGGQLFVEQVEAIKQAIAAFRSDGVAVCVDRLGAGYSGLRLWSDLAPGYVKIDRHLIETIDEDTLKQDLLRSLLDIARRRGCKVIAAGVETREAYAAVRTLGIGYAQGYYFSRPRTLPAKSLPIHLFTPPDKAYRDLVGRRRLSEPVSSVLSATPEAGPHGTVAEAVDLFRASPDLNSLPIVDGGKVLGMLRRAVIEQLIADSDWRETHGKKPLSEVMDRPPVCIEQDVLVEEASRSITDAATGHAEGEFVVVHEGRYVGLARVLDLLRKVTELQVRNARYSNPLTNLPGSVPLDDLMDDLLAEGAPFRLCYADIDNFKPFNDVYGYVRGDQVILLLASVLMDATDTERDTVGHIGGDDFLVVFRSEDWKARCETTLARFANLAPDLYDAKHRKQGGLWTMDRRGHRQFSPLLTLSLAVVSPDPEKCASHHDVAALVTRAKAEAKKRGGNIMFVDRRRRPTRAT